MTEGGIAIPKDDISALILAAGDGVRLGGPKAFIEFEGCTLVERAIGAAGDFAAEIIVGLRGSDMDHGLSILDANALSVVEGGKTRQETVGNLLAAATRTFVLVHESARPFASPRLFREVISAAAEFGAAACCLPASERDAVALAADGMMIEPLYRHRLVRTQPPTVVKRDILLAAYERAETEGWVEESTHALVCRAGFAVRLIEGDPQNRKITFPGDLGSHD